MAEMGNGYGSECHLLRYLGRHRTELDKRVREETGGQHVEWLDYGQARIMIFDERTVATHGRDWQSGRLGTMRYEDVIENGPDKAEKVAFLREAAPYLRL
jgi:hypothetical protein